MIYGSGCRTLAWAEFYQQLKVLSKIFLRVETAGSGLVQSDVDFSKLTGRLNMLLCSGFPKNFSGHSGGPTAGWSRSRMLREDRLGGSVRSVPGYLSKHEN